MGRTNSPEQDDDAARAWGRREGEPPRDAPGAPGAEPRWARRKEGIGTAITPSTNSTSLVWFTLGQGILTEIFYPRVDLACTRDLGLIVTDGEEFFSDERRDADHRVECPDEGVPLYRLINTCREGRYRIEKTIFAHPHQDAVLQVTRFSAAEGGAGRTITSSRCSPPTWGTWGRATPPGWAITRASRCSSPAAIATRWPWRARRPGSPGRPDSSGRPTAGGTCRGTSD